jgi:hypothetical protein
MKKKTFKQVLTQAAHQNRSRLMSRAWEANRLAKVSRGISKQRFYGVKHKALTSLINKFEEDTIVQPDKATPTMLLVLVNHSRFGLHVPRSLIGESFG